MAVVFVYGTLTDPARVESVLDQYTTGPSAVCEGLHRVDGRYPTLAPGGQTTGRLIETPEMDTLDSYEGLDRGLYCRLSVPLSAPDTTSGVESPFGAETAELYVGSPRLLEVEDVVEWPTAGELKQQVARYIDSHAVRIHLNSR